MRSIKDFDLADVNPITKLIEMRPIQSEGTHGRE